MQEEGKSEGLRVHLFGVREEGDVLRVHQLSFVEQAVARLLFSP